MNREVRLTVRLGIPDDASATDVKEFVRDAILSYGGSFMPEDPRQRMGDDVKVTFYRAPIVGSKGA